MGGRGWVSTTLSQINPARSFLFYCLKIHFKIILPSTPGSNKQSLSGLSVKTCMHFSSHDCPIPWPTFSSSYYHLISIRWRELITKVFKANFLQYRVTSCFLNKFSLRRSLLVRDSFSHLYNCFPNIS